MFSGLFFTKICARAIKRHEWGRIMQHIVALAEELCNFLSALPEVKRCELYGSLSRGNYDLYSDIDIMVDVSGTDNSRFVTRLPQIFAQRYNVIFYDYAASLAPDLYVVTLAVDGDNPFRVVDINCTATPHCPGLSQAQVAALCSPYAHALKMLSVYLKQLLRGQDAHGGIVNLYTPLLGQPRAGAGDMDMLREIYGWVKEHAETRHEGLVRSFAQFL